jgi:8-oxo-dGTP pyrophosphatase MutT (NUDIX family)
VTENEMTGPTPQVEAAGGIVWRVVDGVVEVCLVHRPKYDDWTFPKGKLDAGETHEQAAVREVEEETGMRAVLGRELVSTSYRDNKGRPKRVRYWEMTVAGGAFTPNAEVDELVWAGLTEADGELTYRHDREVLAAFARFAAPPT